MAFIRQAVLTLIIAAATLAIWINYVPASLPYLERAGILDVLGVQPASGTPETENGGGGGFGRGGPVSVVAAPVTQRSIDARIEAIGDGQALRFITVRAETAGTVSTVEVAAGSRIESGTVIARLEDESERLDLERARLALENAQTDLDRVSQLAERGAVTNVQSQQARLDLRNAQLSVTEAELALERRTVRAAFDGWIGLISVEVGDRVAAQQEIAMLADRSRIMIEFRVPERAIAQLRTGLPFDARPLAIPGRVLTGEIVAIDNVVDRTSRTLKVQGRLENEDDLLRTGMAFAVGLTIPGEDLPAVDPLSVQWSADGAFVWAVRADKAVRVPVTIRQRSADAVLVEADFEEGDMTVTEGLQALRPGAEVTVAEARSAGAINSIPAEVTQ